MISRRRSRMSWPGGSGKPLIRLVVTSALGLVLTWVPGCGGGDGDGGLPSFPVLTGTSKEAPAGGLPFRLAEGYEATQVAGAPLVEHPMFACFDDRGRLYV